MKNKMDLERLRGDLAEEYYAGGFNGFPAMLEEAWEIENASEGELIRMAQEKGLLEKET